MSLGGAIVATLFTFVVLGVVIPVVIVETAQSTVPTPPNGTEFSIPGRSLEIGNDDLFTQRVCSSSNQLKPRATNERLISNEIFAQSDPIPDSRGLNALVWGWGQFIDHDIILSQIDESLQSDTLELVPNGRNVTLKRVVKRENGETRNLLSAAVDGTTVYGDYKNPQKIATLRAENGTLCKLGTSAGNNLPLNGNMFVCGDERCTEHVLLSSLHTILLREHNRWCDTLESTDWTEEQKFWQARALTVAIIQKITFEEWLPALFGSQTYLLSQDNAKGDYTRISTEFGASAFRFGHSMVANTLGELPLVSLFFNAQRTIELGVDGILERAVAQHAETVDSKVVDGLRDILFGSEDLIVRNLYRGREIGLPSYEDMCTCFETCDANTSGGTDPIVGLLQEEIVSGSSLPKTLAAILAEQFNRLRKEDPHYYTKNLEYFAISQLYEIGTTTMSRLIKRNTNLKYIKENVFFL